MTDEREWRADARALAAQILQSRGWRPSSQRVDPFLPTTNRHERQRTSPASNPPSAVRLDDRLIIAALAVILTLPLGVVAFAVELSRNGGDGLSGNNLSPWIMWPCFWLLGSVWIYEIASRFSGGEVGFSIAAVSGATTLGLLLGSQLLGFVETGAVFIPVGLALVGAFIGTHVLRRPAIKR